MRSIIPIVSIVLALVAAGCIAYIAWQLVNEASDEDDSSDTE